MYPNQIKGHAVLQHAEIVITYTNHLAEGGKRYITSGSVK